MIPAGYLLKRTTRPPGWLIAPHVLEVCSVSACVNDDVVDIVSLWEHNTFGVANDPELLWYVARERNVEIAGVQLFFYEAYELEIDADGFLERPLQWRPLTPVPSGKAETSLAVTPDNMTLLGYDVVVCEDYLEHSPLSCNSVAESLAVNAHCLFSSLAEAKEAIEAGSFKDCEPGVYKIYSVHLVAQA
jgi:hypothetical protein